MFCYQNRGESGGLLRVTEIIFSAGIDDGVRTEQKPEILSSEKHKIFFLSLENNMKFSYQIK